MKTTMIFAAAACAALCAAAFPAKACKCAARAASWHNEQPVVFRARIISTELTSEKAYELPVVAAKFEVMEKFRGQPEQFKFLRTASGGEFGSCGIPFTAGDEFVVFASDAGWATQCTGTKSFHPKRDDGFVKKLRQQSAAK